MAILAATSSQNNRSGSGRFRPMRRKTSDQGAIAQMDNGTNLVETLNAIDLRNIRTTFKQAKDPVELAFDHIDNQPLSKIAKDAVKDSISDMVGGIEDFTDAMTEIKETLGDFAEFIVKMFTSNEEFTPEQI